MGKFNDYINITAPLHAATVNGKLGNANEIFLEGDTQNIENEIKEINSRHEELNKKHDTLSSKHESLSRTVQGIAVTGGASTATNVTYNNDASVLNAENAQDAIDELAAKNKEQDATIATKAEKSDVTSQMQAEQNRVNAELDKKFDNELILQESGEAEDKVMSQKATTTAISEVAKEFSKIETIISASSEGSINAIFNYSAVKQTNNISVTGNGLGEFIVDGEVNEQRIFSVTNVVELSAGTYCLSVVQQNSSPTDSVILEIFKENGPSIASSRVEAAIVTIKELGNYKLCLRTAPNFNYDNYLVKVQFEKGSQGSTWVPPIDLIDKKCRKDIDNIKIDLGEKENQIDILKGWTTYGAEDIVLSLKWTTGRADSSGNITDDTSNYIRTKDFIKFSMPCILKVVNNSATAIRVRTYTSQSGSSIISDSYISVASGETKTMNIDVLKYYMIEINKNGITPQNFNSSVCVLTYSISSILNIIDEEFNLYTDKNKNYLIDTSWFPYKFKPQAHRGVWGSKWHIAQNTIEAFEKAGTIDYIYGIETDVQLTKDNIWVLYHNLDLADLTTGSGAVADHTLAEIQTYRYKSHDTNGKIPTLSEYLKICRKYGKVPYIELKNLTNNTMSLDDAVSSLLNELTKYGFNNRCVLTSFTLDYILAIRKQTNKHICEYMLLSSNHDAPSITAKKIAGLPNMAIRIDESNVTENEVEAYHSLGLLLDAQGLDDGDTTRYNNLLDCGAEGCTCSDWTSIIPN